VPPTTPSGVAHERCDIQNLSKNAPIGKIKLSAAATQIQYLVVALPRGIDVKTKAASQTSEA